MILSRHGANIDQVTSDTSRNFAVAAAVASMIALGRWEEFRLHTRAALVEGKFTKDDIKEIILQQAIYCGVPAANTAVKEAEEVIAEISKK